MLAKLWFSFLAGGGIALCCYAWSRESPKNKRALLGLFQLALGALGLGIVLLWCGGCP